MIKRLKRKFIAITMVSLSLVMILMVGTINIVNYIRTDQEAEHTLDFLSENKGKFPELDQGKMPPKDPKSGFRMNEETRFQTRFFTVALNEDGSVEQIDTGHISAISSSDALNLALKVSQGTRTSGYQGIYRYKMVDTMSGSMIIFMDCRSELSMLMYFFLSSLAVAFGTLFLVFLLVSVLSRKAINPMIENMEKQKQFIMDAGHEIKTPLAIISANADVLELTGGVSEWVNSIRNQVTRLDKLVKNLLTLSKTEEGSLELVFSEFDLSACISEIAASFQAVAEAQQKKLSIAIQPNIMLHGDESCIQQLISTLLDNAMKYSNTQGEIKVSLSSGKKGIRLEVANTTDQMDIKHLDRLFDRFYRADASRSSETGGYGIGLSIAKSIAEAHRGRITATSEDGQSITFTVIL